MAWRHRRAAGARQPRPCGRGATRLPPAARRLRQAARDAQRARRRPGRARGARAGGALRRRAAPLPAAPRARPPSPARAASAGSRRGRRRTAASPPPVTSQNSSHTSRSRARSWLTSMTVPSNSLSAMLSASRVVRSRWLVGSSSSSRFGRCQTSIARTRRAFSPPDSVPTGCCTISPVKRNEPRKSRSSCSRAAGPTSRARRTMCISGPSAGDSTSSSCCAK